jgi:hypothetical protein
LTANLTANAESKMLESLDDVMTRKRQRCHPAGSNESLARSWNRNSVATKRFTAHSLMNSRALSPREPYDKRKYLDEQSNDRLPLGLPFAATTQVFRSKCCPA